MTLKFDGWPRKIIGHLLFATSSFVHHLKSISKFKLKLQPRNAQFGSKSAIFCPVWTWNLTDDLEKQQGTLLCYFNTSLVHHFVANDDFIPELQSGNALFGQNQHFLSCVTLKFDQWPWKIIGHLFYATSSFVHHFVAIGEFKLELQSGNSQFGSKWTIFFSRVTLKFDGWLSKTIGHLFYATSSFVHHFVAIGEFKLEL